MPDNEIRPVAVPNVKQMKVIVKLIGNNHPVWR